MQRSRVTWSRDKLSVARAFGKNLVLIKNAIGRCSVRELLNLGAIEAFHVPLGKSESSSRMPMIKAESVSYAVTKRASAPCAVEKEKRVITQIAKCRCSVRSCVAPGQLKH